MLAGVCVTPGYALGVAVEGELAFVAAAESGLCIIDVSNPSSPFEVGCWDTPGVARDVAVAGDNAFVADGGGVRVVNIAEPAAPVEIGYYETDGYTYGVAVQGNAVYVGDDSRGLVILHYPQHLYYLPVFHR